MGEAFALVSIKLCCVYCTRTVSGCMSVYRIREARVDRTHRILRNRINNRHASICNRTIYARDVSNALLTLRRLKLS